MKRAITLLTSALLLFGLTGCAKEIKVMEEEPFAAAEAFPAEPAAAITVGMNPEELFSSRDYDASVDTGSAQQIDLNTADGIVRIQEEGIYILSGQLTGQIQIDAGKKDKIQLVLNEVSIQNPSSAAIYIKQADKVFLTLADNTENTLCVSGPYEAIDENNIDGVIFSRSDLTLNGSGSLKISAQEGHGVVSKDELTVTGGSYEIAAAAHGMTGKDGIAISGGSFRIQSGRDGIHAENKDDAASGGVYIGGGTFTVVSGEDGISAAYAMQIDGGTFSVTSGGGSAAVTMRPSDGQRGNTAFYGSETSAKGIKAGSTLILGGGGFTLDCADDGIHAGGDILITAGDYDIRTADDGIHSDSVTEIRGGSITIPYCYEGIEGENVTISGGSIDILSADDGINAAGGMDGSGFGQEGRFGGSSVISVSGGSLTVVSDGDSLDSNGSILLTGGELNLTCRGNGNTAIDCDGSYSNTGAQVTTNDGSENGTMFSGHGGMGGRGFGGQRPEGSFQRPEGDFRRQQRPGGKVK